MKKRKTGIWVCVLLGILLCLGGCSRKGTPLYRNMVLDTCDVRRSNLGDTVEQVKSTEYFAPVQTLTGEKAEKLMGPGTMLISYDDMRLAGTDASIKYLFRDGLLGEAHITLKTDSTKELYRDLVKHFNKTVGWRKKHSGNGSSAGDFSRYEKDGKVMEIVVSTQEIFINVGIDGEPILYMK